MTLHRTDIDTPIGAAALVTRGETLVALVFAEHWDRITGNLAARFGAEAPAAGPGGQAAARFRDYLAGDLQALDGLALDPGGTPFQQQVWAALRRIPAGRTISYGELARAIERPTAFRAVAAANGQNPISIAIPCHRVIAADGKLHGYGGGLPRKAWLLAHEGAVP